jgi:DNA repair protein RadC
MRTDTLYVRDDCGEFIPARPDLILARAKEHLKRRMRRGAPLRSPEVVRDFLAVTLADRDCEYFCLMCLDGHHRLLRFVELFRGTIDRASVHPREVVKLALESQAVAVLLVHNHPSMVDEVSSADELISKRLVAALDLIDVRVLDHLIVAGATVVSMAERGLL